MNLIEKYIQEVTRRLPERNREDIALELRSTIEDMLPDDYTEQDVENVLTQMGDPVLLAREYRDWPQYLIGPRYFEVYMTLLKIGSCIGAAIALIAYLAQQAVGFTGEESFLSLFPTFIIGAAGSVIEAAMQVFFWTTLSFAIVERTDPSKDGKPFTLKKWSPDDLKDVPDRAKERRISHFEVFGGLFWTAVWGTVYYHADHLVGIYHSDTDGMEFVTPIFNQEILHMYWPAMIMIIILEIALSLFKWKNGKWTIKLAAFNTILQIICTAVFILIINQAHLFDTGFITYLGQSSYDRILKGIINLAIIIFFMGAAYNAYDGFRKAKR